MSERERFNGSGVIRMIRRILRLFYDSTKECDHRRMIVLHPKTPAGVRPEKAHVNSDFPAIDRLPIYKNPPPEHKIYDLKSDLLDLNLSAAWNWKDPWEQHRAAEIFHAKLPALYSAVRFAESELSRNDLEIDVALDSEDALQICLCRRRRIILEKRLARLMGIIQFVESQRRL